MNRFAEGFELHRRNKNRLSKVIHELYKYMHQINIYVFTFQKYLMVIKFINQCAGVA